MSDAHLHSAARAWCRVLAARHPEHTFYPVVRPERYDAYSRTTRPGYVLEPMPEPGPENPDALTDGDGSASSADTAHDDDLQQSA